MQVSVDWLKDYVSPGASAHEIAERLTNSLNEVDEIRSVDHLKRIKVGEVEEVTKHPNADNLWVTKTRIGTRRYTIVCGADNVAAGQKVATALPGTTLPDGLKIAKRRIRGIESHGMLCSPKELGIGEDHRGIWVLPANAKSGVSLSAALKGAADSFELETPANRPDGLGHLGVAREVAAAFAKPLKAPKLKSTGKRKPGIFAVKVADRQATPRYLLARISGLKNGESPDWLKRRLVSVGLRPINLVVDVTNFVMLETGQPLHAFDVSKVTGTVIFVRNARPDESLTTIDKKLRRLTPADLVIADRTQLVGIAGVMGGSTTEVGKSSTDILLECAVFDPARVRRTSRRLGLRSDASARFEKGLPPAMSLDALRRAIDLITELGGGSVAQVVDEYPRKTKHKAISLTDKRLESYLGVRIPTARAVSYLKRLGFSVRKNRQGLTATPPPWRTDVSEEADLIEEITRLHGYDRVPATLPAAPLRAEPIPPERQLRRDLIDWLIGAGYSEVVTHSLVGETLLAKSGFPRKLARVANPLSEDHAYLRGNMGPRHLEAIEANLRWRDELRFFEIGRVFEPAGRGVEEQTELMATIGTKTDADYLEELRGVLQMLGHRLRLGELAFEQTDLPKFAKGRHWQVRVGNARIGWLAEYGAPKKFKAGRAFFLSLNLDRLRAAIPAGRSVTAPPNYPPVYRDLSVFVPQNGTYAALWQVVRQAGGALLGRAGPPEPYRHRGRASLTLKLAFRHPERTLSDAEVGEAMQRVERAAKKAGYSVRS